jgi:hypothetical protein
VRALARCIVEAACALGGISSRAGILVVPSLATHLASLYKALSFSISMSPPATRNRFRTNHSSRFRYPPQQLAIDFATFQSISMSPPSNSQSISPPFQSISMSPPSNSQSTSPPFQSISMSPPSNSQSISVPIDNILSSLLKSDINSTSDINSESRRQLLHLSPDEEQDAKRKLKAISGRIRAIEEVLQSKKSVQKFVDGFDKKLPPQHYGRISKNFQEIFQGSDNDKNAAQKTRDDLCSAQKIRDDLCSYTKTRPLLILWWAIVIPRDSWATNKMGFLVYQGVVAELINLLRPKALARKAKKIIEELRANELKENKKYQDFCGKS